MMSKDVPRAETRHASCAVLRVLALLRLPLRCFEKGNEMLPGCGEESSGLAKQRSLLGWAGLQLSSQQPQRARAKEQLEKIKTPSSDAKQILQAAPITRAPTVCLPQLALPGTELLPPALKSRTCESRAGTGRAEVTAGPPWGHQLRAFCCYWQCDIVTLC